MSTETREFPFLSNVGLMLTYRCSIACPHCIVEAGPHRREAMPVDDAHTWIRQIRDYRDGTIGGVALTGGEPFYDLDTLRSVSTLAAGLGLVVSAVTNSFWASDPAAAVATLESLPGIRLLSFSTDAYHQRAIPLSRVENAIGAARRTGRLHNIAVCTDREDEPVFRTTLARLDEIGEREHTRVSITFPVGRALKRSGLLNHTLVEEPVHSACSMASSPVIFPNGDVIGCIGPVFTLPRGHPLFLGNLHAESLATILDRAEHNPVLHALRVWGPHRLVALLRDSGGAALLPDRYIENCICDVCYKLLGDPAIVARLAAILGTPEMIERIAYARVHYLQEETMARDLLAIRG